MCRGGEEMEKHDIMDKFAEMTKKLIQQVMNEPDLRKVNPDLIREIRENVREILSH